MALLQCRSSVVFTGQHHWPRKHENTVLLGQRRATAFARAAIMSSSEH